MDIMRTKLDGVILIKPKIYDDMRGYFLELYQEKRYEEAGITAHFVQDNFVHSHKGVLRGLHFQTKNSQDKLVMVTHGSIFDVAVWPYTTEQGITTQMRKSYPNLP
ncbi:MAG: dTDP-4-dehydrorhamnose 3,5-epimerase family protein [Gammaproteobacteria bacterium]|nr:dTDP-4-dehydrorhamnose 3,5-epimerase family protein [Gammaproteobacteria bacterium]